MSEQGHVARNATFAIIGQVGQFIIMAIYFVLVSQYFNNTEMGIFAFATGVTGLLFVLIDMGVSTHVVREIARDSHCATVLLPRVMGLKLIVGIIFMAGVFIFSTSVKGPEGTGSALRLMSVMLIVGPLSNTYLMLFRATEKMGFYAIAQVVNRGIMLLLIPFVIMLDLGLNGVIFSHILGSVSVFILIAFILKKYYSITPGISFSWRGWKRLVIASIPFMAMNMLWEVYNKVDQIIIPALDSFEANGNYAIAYKYAFITLAIPMALGSAMFPFFVRKAGNDVKSMARGASEMYRYLGIMAFGVAAFIGIPSLQWIVLLSGKKYSAAAPTLTLFCACMPIIFMQGIHISILYSFNRQNIVLTLTFVSVFIDVVLDIILIPYMGIFGAGLATFACNVLLFIGTYTVASKETGGPLPYFRNIAKPFACSLISGALLFWIIRNYFTESAQGFFTSNFAFIVPTFLCGLLYLGLLLLTRCITRADFELFKMIIGKK